MKKFFVAAFALVFTSMALAQDTTIPRKTTPVVANRANDHFMLQFGYDGWSGAPDSARTSGFSRHFNVYFMLNRPFKTNPHFSVALGAGIGSSNIFFNKTYVDVKARSTRLPFTNVDSANHFDKFKLTSIYADVPIELRWVANAANPDNSFKVAVGAKVGALLKAYTKGKDLQTKSGSSLYGSKYIMKESDKRFFNSTRLAVTGRIGFGHFSLHGQYTITNFLKEGAGAEIRPYSIGLTISGL